MKQKTFIGNAPQLTLSAISLVTLIYFCIFLIYFYLFMFLLAKTKRYGYFQAFQKTANNDSKIEVLKELSSHIIPIPINK